MKTTNNALPTATSPISLPASLPTSLPVRKLLLDLSAGFDRHWFRGANGKPDAFRSMYFNAMSMSFPAGEQSFIDSVEAVKARLGNAPEHQRLKNLLPDFSAQEATHRHIHGLMNAQLSKQGLVNSLEPRVHARIAHYAHMNPLHHLAVTVAYEHYTAILAELMLTRPQLSEGMSPAMRQLWLWHALEEAEHKAVAFDLYQALSGNTFWRRRWFAQIMIVFMLDSIRQTCRNLWHDGSLFKPSTWLSALQFFLGHPSKGGGWFWMVARPLLAYFRKDFHPNQLGDPAAAKAYAQKHAQDWRLIR